MITLHRAPFSTNVERVALALAHKGLEVESVVIDKEDRSPVEQVSGQGLVPVIVDVDDTVVVDSTRILRHLDQRYPEPPLFPADPTRRAEMDLFLDWFNELWKLAPNNIELLLTEEEPDREAIEYEARRMTDALDLFEGMLAGRDYLMGDSPSAADFAAFPFVKYARIPPDPEDEELYHRILGLHQSTDGHPRLAAWIERIDALPRA